MPVLITHDDFTKWYSKINVLRKQSGIGASTISETASLKSNSLNNALRMSTVIDNINNARNLHTLLQQTSGALSKTNIEPDKVSLEATVNDINTKLHNLLRTCVNLQNSTVVPQGCNISSGNSKVTNTTCKTYGQTSGNTTYTTYGQTSSNITNSTNNYRSSYSTDNYSSSCSTNSKNSNCKTSDYDCGTVSGDNSNHRVITVCITNTDNSNCSTYSNRSSCYTNDYTNSNSTYITNNLTSGNTTNVTNSYSSGNTTNTTYTQTSCTNNSNLTYSQTPATYSAINHYTDEEADRRT